MKTKSKFKKIYLIFLAACVLLSIAFLIYVWCVVRDFDKSQPEHVARQQAEQISLMAANGTLASELNLKDACTNPYENNDANSYINSYISRIKGAGITYEYTATESNELSKKYNILADGKSIGTLNLVGENSRSRLFFFNMADWKVESFSPVLADTVYNLRVYVPDGVEVLINGVKPTAEELDSSESVPVYSINGLFKEPVISYKKADGKEIRFTGENNVIKPALYDYQFSAPTGIDVSVNGKIIDGEDIGENQKSYTILAMEKPEVAFADAFGDTRAYYGEENPAFSSCDVIIPENYKLSINGKDAESLCTPVNAPHPDAEVLLKQAGVKLLNRKTFNISTIKPNAKAVVSDENGNQKEFTLDNKTLELNSLGSDEIPENISAQVDVMKIAKNWSRFMTDDLPGAMHGLYTVYDYFIKDSDYYNYAYEWATGSDIGFTSVHTLDSFKNEKISNFTQYNDKCFSCEVYFEKNMTLYSNDIYVGKRTDVFNSVMYFVNVDDTPDNGKDDPHWAIAVMHDVV